MVMLSADEGVTFQAVETALRRARVEASHGFSDDIYKLLIPWLRIGAALRSGYEFELKHLPSAYEATYRLWYRVPWLCPGTPRP